MLRNLQKTYNKNLVFCGELNNPSGWMEKLENLAIEMEAIDSDLGKSNKELIMAILDRLPKEYKLYIQCCKQELDDGLLTLATTKERVFGIWEEHFEPKLRGKKKNKKSVALNTESKKEVLMCSHCGKKGHTKECCWELKTCNNCSKLGHITKFCLDKNKEGTKGQVSFVGCIQGEESAKKEESANSVCMTVRDNEETCVTKERPEWFLMDSGANVHTVENAKHMCYLKPLHTHGTRGRRNCAQVDP